MNKEKEIVKNRGVILPPSAEKWSSKLKNRYSYLINKLKYNPILYGFGFDFFVNGASLCFSKELEDRTILLTLNSWHGKAFFSLYRDTYCTKIFSFKRLLDKREFERVLRVSERYQQKGKMFVPKNNGLRFVEFIYPNNLSHD